ncbi:hypothetical protein N7476_005842 [Penicillium atrosanguineum]|uniref:Uncharacterized protein n=1 Tax=Penicillium atrosanguineum TaxID=1132637 RepID=A0A9W9PWF5_9EURO|nr:hypothetical protein N7476_005842 [Penicillium atrosanguineum]
MSGQKSSGNSTGSFLEDSFWASAKVGGLTGAAGIIYGGAAGVIRSRHPLVHSLAHGIHWTSYEAVSSILISMIKPPPQERAFASALSGGISGAVVTRAMGGRPLPGLIIFSLLGYCGQSAFNRVDRWQMEMAQNPGKPILQRMAESKWIPLRHLSDEDYRGILGEKLLSIEAEIALLDEKIQELENTRPAPKKSDTDNPVK